MGRSMAPPPGQPGRFGGIGPGQMSTGMGMPGGQAGMRGQDPRMMQMMRQRQMMQGGGGGPPPGAQQSPIGAQGAAGPDPRAAMMQRYAQMAQMQQPTASQGLAGRPPVQGANPQMAEQMAQIAALRSRMGGAEQMGGGAAY
jgi:hypothetical protein